MPLLGERKKELLILTFQSKIKGSNCQKIVSLKEQHMKKIQAFYKEGKIIPLEALSLSEGEKISVLILQGDENLKEQFFKNREKYKFSLPKDYNFSREELHDR